MRRGEGVFKKVENEGIEEGFLGGEVSGALKIKQNKTK